MIHMNDALSRLPQATNLQVLQIKGLMCKNKLNSFTFSRHAWHSFNEHVEKLFVLGVFFSKLWCRLLLQYDDG